MPALLAFLQGFVDTHPVAALQDCAPFDNCMIVGKETVMTEHVVLFKADGRGIDYFEPFLRAGFAAMLLLPSDAVPFWLTFEDYAAYAFADTHETLFVLKHSTWKPRLEAAMREGGYTLSN